MNSITREEILNKLQALAPWHMDIALPQGLSTGMGNQEHYAHDIFNDISLNKPYNLENFFSRLYGDNGLKGKRVLDVACNAGGYSFLASDMGASYCYAFDARAHWINQAKLIQQLKGIPTDKLVFKQHPLSELSVPQEKFDVALFFGIFYHLPNPIGALELLAQSTNDMIIINSASNPAIPAHTMSVKMEATEPPMSGIDGLSWLPGGPEVVHRICRSLGFPYFHVVFERKTRNPSDTRKSAIANPHRGHFMTVVARREEMLASFK